MHRKQIPLADVFDARALRVIVDDEHGTRMQEAIQACYRWEQPALPLVLVAQQATSEQQEGLPVPSPDGNWAGPRRSSMHLRFPARPKTAAPCTVMDCHVPS